MKKSTYKILAEAFTFSGLKKIGLPTKRIDSRRLTIDEIKSFIKEEFGKAKKAAEVEADEEARGWGDAEIENNIDWVKKLNLKEFFAKKTEK